MRIYSRDRNMVVVYSTKQIESGLLYTGKTLATINSRNYSDAQIISFITDCINQFESEGADFLITDPPTYNPLFAKYLIMARSSSCKVYLGRNELTLSNLRTSLINYLNPKISDQSTQFCKIRNEDHMLKLPMQFSWGLNGNDPLPIFRWMEFDKVTKVVNRITTTRPVGQFCLITNNFWPGDENIYDIRVGPNGKLSVKRK